jgi:hypothetical protein
MKEEAEDGILFEDTLCVCGNIATESVVSYERQIAMGICKSCKWMIDNGEHDPPSDKIRELMWGKKNDKRRIRNRK